ncbi:hypothetical protein H8D79_01020 [PVC group bacterium]|nr:hypothetical protein [PVC group bacterium]
MKKFRFSGVAVVQMPARRKRVMTPGSGYRGDIVAIDHQGRVAKRLGGQQGSAGLPVAETFEPGQM